MSSATANILYFFISHPAAYKQLQAEVDGLGDKLTDCSTQAQLPYLKAVMYIVSVSPKLSLCSTMCYLVTEASDYYLLLCLGNNVLQK